MEDKNETGIIDDLNTPSITKKEPMFKLSNVFKPSSRNIIIIGTMMKIIAAGVVAGVAGLFVINAEKATYITIGAVIFGAIGEGLVLFSKEEPLSSLVRAAEDINLEVQNQTQIEQSNDTI